MSPVARERVHAHERGRVLLADARERVEAGREVLAHHDRGDEPSHFSRGERAVAVRGELAVLRRQLARASCSISSSCRRRYDCQVLDRRHRERVRLGEGLEPGHAHHRAVVVHDLAQRADRREPREPAQVDGRLGVAVALAASRRPRARSSRCARPVEVGRLRVGARHGAQRARAVRGRDAGRDLVGREVDPDAAVYALPAGSTRSCSPSGISEVAEAVAPGAAAQMTPDE